MMEGLERWSECVKDGREEGREGGNEWLELKRKGRWKRRKGGRTEDRDDERKI